MMRQVGPLLVFKHGLCDADQCRRKQTRLARDDVAIRGLQSAECSLVEEVVQDLTHDLLVLVGLLAR